MRDKFVYILASAYLPVESPDLEHSPEGAFYCRYFVDGTCFLQSDLLCGLRRAVAPGIGTCEHFGVRTSVARQVELAFGGKTAEHGEVEVDNRFSRGEESLVGASGLDVHHRFYGRSLHAKFLGHAAVIFVGETYNLGRCLSRYGISGLCYRLFCYIG